MESIDNVRLSSSTRQKASVHQFVHKYQFLMGVAFSLLCLGASFAIIGLIAALPHYNVHYEVENHIAHRIPTAGIFGTIVLL